MKPLSLLRAIPLLPLLFAFHFSTAGGANVMGQVTDPETKEPVADATVIFDCQGNQRYFFTNEHGYYYASNIPAGVYTIIVSFLSNTTKVPDVALASDEVREINIPLSKSIELAPVVFHYDPNPLIDALNPEVGMLDRKTIDKLPITKVDDLGEIIGNGAIEINGELYVRGARSGSMAYYIDGCKVMGTPDIPLCGLETYRTYTGFIPPKYGDTVAGVVVIETRGYFSEQRNRE